jgi:hypothetical protein
VLLEKLAKSFNLYGSDGQVVINLNKSEEHRIDKLISELSDDEMRAFLRRSDTNDELAEALGHHDIYNPSGPQKRNVTPALPPPDNTEVID